MYSFFTANCLPRGVSIKATSPKAPFPSVRMRFHVLIEHASKSLTSAAISKIAPAVATRQVANWGMRIRSREEKKNRSEAKYNFT
jgi:hypothetical protein